MRALPCFATSLLLLLAGGCNGTPENVRIVDFAWLAGTWTGTNDRDMTIEQQWSAPRAGSVTGIHRGSRNGEVVVIGEFRLIGGENGVVLLGSPDGRPAANYPLLRLSGSSAIFGNNQVEWPREVSFSRSGDSLGVRFAGLDGTGTLRETEYELRLSGPPLPL